VMLIFLDGLPEPDAGISNRY